MGLEVHFDGAVADGPDDVEHETLGRREGGKEGGREEDKYDCVSAYDMRQVTKISSLLSIVSPPPPSFPPYSLDPLTSRQLPRLQHESTHALRVGELRASHNLFFRHGVPVYFL